MLSARLDTAFRFSCAVHLCQEDVHRLCVTYITVAVVVRLGGGPRVSAPVHSKSWEAFRYSGVLDLYCVQLYLHVGDDAFERVLHL